MNTINKLITIPAMVLAGTLGAHAGHYEDGMQHAVKQEYKQAIVDFTADYKVTGNVHALEQRANCHMLSARSFIANGNQDSAKVQYVSAARDFSKLLDDKISQDKSGDIFMLNMAYTSIAKIDGSSKDEAIILVADK